MKNFLVLTGTAGYEMLEQSITNVAKSNTDYHFVLQTKNTIQDSKNITHESFIQMNDIDCKKYDGVIGHCGAGTAFWALAKKLPFLAVVNLDRVDSHQQDLGGWLEKHNYALVVYNKPVTAENLEELTTRKFAVYEKDNFMFDKFDALCSNG